MAAASKNCCAGVVVGIFIGPLPDVSNHVHYAEGAGATRMSVNIAGLRHDPAIVRWWCGRGHRIELPRTRVGATTGDRREPVALAPGVDATIAALSGVLPFPLVGQALARPASIVARIFKRYPGHGLVSCSVRKRAVYPIL